MIQVNLSSIFVNDQEKALDFYTNKIGFEKKADVPLGEYKWPTVGQKGDVFEMLLEPNVHPAAKAYQKTIFEEGIPATMFFVDGQIKKNEKRFP